MKKQISTLRSRYQSRKGTMSNVSASQVKLKQKRMQCSNCSKDVNAWISSFNFNSNSLQVSSLVAPNSVTVSTADAFSFIFNLPPKLVPNSLPICLNCSKHIMELYVKHRAFTESSAQGSQVTSTLLLLKSQIRGQGNNSAVDTTTVAPTVRKRRRSSTSSAENVDEFNSYEWISPEVVILSDVGENYQQQQQQQSTAQKSSSNEQDPLLDSPEESDSTGAIVLQKNSSHQTNQSYPSTSRGITHSPHPSSARRNPHTSTFGTESRMSDSFSSDTIPTDFLSSIDIELDDESPSPSEQSLDPFKVENDISLENTKEFIPRAPYRSPRDVGPAQGEHSEVVDSIQAHSRRCYKSAWQAYLRWCELKQAGPSLPTILSYFTHLQTQGRSYNTISLHRSALSLYAPKIDGMTIGQHPSVSDLLRGFRIMGYVKAKQEQQQQLN